MEVEDICMEKKRIFGNCDSVQLPPPGFFTSEDLIWHPVRKGGRTGGDREEAWILHERLKDFVKGESCRTSFQCTFKVRKTEKKKTGVLVKSYWCSYGPQDERTVSIHNWAELQTSAKEKGKKGRGLGSRPAARTVDVGLSMRRGCRCHFNIFMDPQREGSALISWVERAHIDIKGEICHGLLCMDAKLSNHEIAPRLSQECIQFVERLLRSRVPVAEIIAEHQQRIAEVVRNVKNGQKINWTRDMQLMPVDIRNIQTRLRKKGQLYHSNDAEAVRQWTQRFPDHVVHYQEQNKEKGEPFSLVFSTPWMIRNLAIYGQERAVALDATHGTNMYGFQLFTWVVYNTHQNGLPVVWALLERHRTEDLEMVQQKIKEKVQKEYPEITHGNFQPSCFITDDCAEEKNSIRLVYPDCPLDLCIWHVRCSWNKNLMSKVRHPVHRTLMNKELGHIMYTESDPVQVSTSFVERWKFVEPLFVNYYMETWAPKIREWVLQYRHHRRSNQNTTGAVERWHATLKAHIRSSRLTKALRKLSWLVILLTSTIELYYWCSAELKYQGRIRNKVVEDQVVTVCVKARSIPDSCMKEVEEDGVKLRLCQSERHPDIVYTISDWGTSESRCTCNMSFYGNLCKHEVKALFIDGFTETDIVKARGRKYGSAVGGAVASSSHSDHPLDLNIITTEEELPSEPEFHFPFAMSSTTTEEEENIVTVEDVFREITNFSTTVEGDSFYMSHVLIGCKKAIEDVLNMRAQIQSGTWTHLDLSKTVPHPIVTTGEPLISTDLTRKKGWYERMMEGYQKPRINQALQVSEGNCAIPFERTVKVPFVPLNQVFDAEALQFVLGGKPDSNRKNKKRKVQATATRT